MYGNQGHTQKDTTAVHVENLYKSYGSLEVLKGVSLDAHDGDVISIIGSSGSGKSTFLRCINLIELPSAGSITIAGEAVKFKPAKSGEMRLADAKQIQRLRTNLGMVFQSFNLWRCNLCRYEGGLRVGTHCMGWHYSSFNR